MKQMNKKRYIRVSRAALIFIVITLLIALILSVIGLSSLLKTTGGLGSAVVVDKNSNSASRGLLYTDLEKIELIMESYGEMDHSYISQEISVDIGNDLENMMCLTAHYNCETPYYERPQDSRNTNVPKDAEFDWVEVSSISSSVETKHLDEIQKKLSYLSDVKINKSYIESILKTSAKTNTYIEMVDETNERFNVIYTTEVSPYLGYIINVRVDTDKKRLYNNIDATPKDK